MHKEDFIRHIPDWEAAMLAGLMNNGRPYSKESVKIYVYYLRQFFRNQEGITRASVKKQLMSIPPERFGKRDKVFKAVVCFVKYLADEGLFKEGFLDEIKNLRPRRHIPAKRSVLFEDEVKLALESCRNFTETATFLFVLGTGLRVSELCNLKWSDINLSEGQFTVQNGKWGRTRTLGLTTTALEGLKLMRGKHHDFVFGGVSRYTVYKRLRRIGVRAGVHTHPHALRRSCGTLSLKNGASIREVQEMYGHRAVSTTENYCMVIEKKLVDSMKNWKFV